MPVALTYHPCDQSVLISRDLSDISRLDPVKGIKMVQIPNSVPHELMAEINQMASARLNSARDAWAKVSIIADASAYDNADFSLRFEGENAESDLCSATPSALFDDIVQMSRDYFQAMRYPRFRIGALTTSEIDLKLHFDSGKYAQQPEKRLIRVYRGQALRWVVNGTDLDDAAYRKIIAAQFGYPDKPLSDINPSVKTESILAGETAAFAGLSKLNPAPQSGCFHSQPESIANRFSIAFAPAPNSF